MVFGLTIGTERANALQVRAIQSFFVLFLVDLVLFSQNAIQQELMKRGFSPDAGKFSGTASMHSNSYTGGYTDPVMAEYITIMIINNKTPGTSISCSRPWALALVSSVLTLSATTAQITSELEDCKHHIPSDRFMPG